MSSAELSVLFLLQLTVILTACQLAGLAARRVGQPLVVAEMVAGVLLGPSVFGLLLPDIHKVLFPIESSPILFAVSQIGIVLYLFLVGVDFRTDLFLSRLTSAAAISLAGMIVPFVSGVGVGLWLSSRPGEFFEAKVRPWEGAIFVGAAMCITAFPMLARIIVERRLSATTLGTLTLAAGAMGDAAAWCLLAVLFSKHDSKPASISLVVGGTTVFLLVVLTIGRKSLAVLERRIDSSERLSPNVLSVVLLLMTLGAWVSDLIGTHAVFGAFILGCAMPRGKFGERLVAQLEPMTTALLVPVFFTCSGLNTRLDLVTSPRLLLIALIVFVVACLGKGVGCWAAARLTGESRRTSLAVGTLMNARGLMELIILNIGLERRLITPALFSIMVLMAVGTTVMTSPILDLIGNDDETSNDNVREIE